MSQSDTKIPFDWPDHPERTTVASSYCNDCLHPGHMEADCARCWRELNGVSPLHEYSKVACQVRYTLPQRGGDR